MDKKACKLYAREMKAFHACTQDSLCTRDVKFYKEGYRKLGWMQDNCPLENNP